MKKSIKSAKKKLKTTEKETEQSQDNVVVETQQTVEDAAEIKPTSDDDGDVSAKDQTASEPSPSKGFWQKFKAKKVWIPITVVGALVILIIVPGSRYALLGTVLKKNFDVQILDAQTNQPISGVAVTADGVHMSTDSQGMAHLDLRVGHVALTVSKKYYATLTRSVLVPVHQHGLQVLSLTATGRQVAVLLTNKITGKAVANARITIDGSTSQTAANGEAVVVLPASAQKGAATLAANGFNSSSVSISNTTNVNTNTFSLVPTGRVYFLSNTSGKIDVVGTNLDGSDQQVIVTGTGNEDPFNTQFTHSVDWKYLALVANRTGSLALYTINTATKKITAVDTSNATFLLDGWSRDDHLIYHTIRNDIQRYQPNRETLFSYDPSTNTNITIDQTDAGSATYGINFEFMYQELGNVNILANDTVLYTKLWQLNSGYVDSLAKNGQSTLDEVQANGQGKKILIGVGPTVFTSGMAIQTGPTTLYWTFNNGGNLPAYFEFNDGTISQLSSQPQRLIPWVYYLSPSGKETASFGNGLGGSSISVGNSFGENGAVIASLGPTFTNFIGWYGNDYLIIGTNTNTLYIMPATGGVDTSNLTKIGDSFQPGS